MRQSNWPWCLEKGRSAAVDRSAWTKLSEQIIQLRFLVAKSKLTSQSRLTIILNFSKIRPKMHKALCLASGKNNCGPCAQSHSLVFQLRRYRYELPSPWSQYVKICIMPTASRNDTPMQPGFAPFKPCNDVHNSTSITCTGSPLRCFVHLFVPSSSYTYVVWNK